MDLDFSPEEEAFRHDARRFIAGSYPVWLREKQDRETVLTREDYNEIHRNIIAKLVLGL